MKSALRLLRHVCFFALLLTQMATLRAANPIVPNRGLNDPHIHTTIPVQHARYMKKRADTVKAPEEIFIVHNAGHNWRKVGGELNPSLDDIVEKTAAFMKQQLDKASSK